MAYRVDVDVSELLGASAEITAALRARVDFAVRAIAEEGASRWREAVLRAHLWQGEKEKYIKTIGWKPTGEMQALLFATYEHAHEIETGRPSRDLKAYLQTSRKTREVKRGPHAGQKYLVIPFRHNVPTASGKGVHAPQMAASIYPLAKALAPSYVRPPGSIKERTRISASGHRVRQHSFAWGGRLPSGLAPKLKEHHRTDPYAGMVRFDTSPRRGATRAKSSAYLTFRVMGEWSDGWIVGERPGQYLARGVSGSLHGMLAEAIKKAVARS